jgi:hypothetical protein
VQRPHHDPHRHGRCWLIQLATAGATGGLRGPIKTATAKAVRGAYAGFLKVEEGKGRICEKKESLGGYD